MNSDDFEYLLMYTRMTLEGDRVVFVPFNGVDKTIVDKLVQKNSLDNISAEQFMKLANQLYPIIQTKKKLREKKISDFKNMSSEDAAQLSLKEKVEYLGAIFHRCQTQDNLDNIYSENKEQLKSLLYNIQYPKEFFQKEEQLADRFISLVSNNSQITDNMKNWSTLELEDKKATIKETAKIIEYAYGASLNIDFYTSEEYRKENNLSENAHVPGAQHDSSTGKISFNTERLDSNNYMGISVLFHEFMHQRQREIDFGDPSINKLFELSNMLYNAYNYESRNVASSSPEFGDFYSLMPDEIHSFAMQKYVEDGIMEKTGIEKTREETSKTTIQVHAKSFAMAASAKYRSTNQN